MSESYSKPIELQRLLKTTIRILPHLSTGFELLGKRASIAAESLVRLSRHKRLGIWKARGPVRWRNMMKAVRQMGRG